MLTLRSPCDVCVAGFSVVTPGHYWFSIFWVLLIQSSGTTTPGHMKGHSKPRHTSQIEPLSDKIYIALAPFLPHVYKAARAVTRRGV